MMLTKFVRIQLTIFAVLTVVGLIVMATQYVRVPAMVGIGRYDVTVELPATGGLYKNSNVTYRGVQIGRVTDVRATREGAEELAEAALFLSGGWLASGETLFIDSGQHLLAQPRDVLYLARA